MWAPDRRHTGIYIEPRTGGAIANCNLEISFESIGNELVHDATIGGGSSPTISGTTWTVGEFSYSSAKRQPAIHPSIRFMLRCGTPLLSSNFGGQYGFGTGPPGGTAAFGSPIGSSFCTFDMLPHRQQVNGVELDNAYVNPQRPITNFVAGTGVTITPTDDQPNQRTTLTFTAAASPAPTTIIAGGYLGATYALAMAAAIDVRLFGTLNANCALTTSGWASGTSRAELILMQDATGGRTLTINGTSVTFASTAANSAGCRAARHR